MFNDTLTCVIKYGSTGTSKTCAEAGQVSPAGGCGSSASPSTSDLPTGAAAVFFIGLVGTVALTNSGLPRRIRGRRN